MSAADDDRWTETETAIMEATFRALCEHGYADLTLRKIAAEFEKSRALIYQYYATKETLFAALVQYLIDRYEAHMALDDAGDARARLERYVEVALFGPDDPDFDHWAFHTALLEFRVRGHHDEEIRSLVRRGYDRVVDLVAGIVADGIEEGHFRDVDPEAAAALIVGAIDAARALKIAGVDDRAPETFHAAIHDLLLPGIYRST